MTPSSSVTSSKKKLSLGIVQTHPTQFDGPLFRGIAQKNDFNLMVYYTKTMQGLFDPEVGRNPNWSDENIEGYESYRASNGFFGQLWALLNILKQKHDLMIFSGYKSFFYFVCPYVCRFFGIATGLRSDNILCNENKNSVKWRVKRLILPTLFRIYTTGYPVGTLAADYLKNFGFSSKKIFLLPYTIDADKFRLQYERQQSFACARREKLGIPESSFVILGVMKLVAREDPMTLLRAFEKVTVEHPQVHLVLVGSGELERPIKDFITQNSLTRVHLTGYIQRTDLAAYYSIADVFVHPAVKESWGVSVHESLACGVPVISSDRVGAAADLVLPENCGLVFKAGDSDMLARLLKTVITNRKMLMNFSQNSNKVMERWSIDSTIRNLYASLIAVSGLERAGGVL